MKKEFFKSSIGKLGFVDLNESSTKGTVVFLAGWGETIESTKQTINEILKRNYRVIAVEFLSLDPFIKKEEGMPQVEYVKAMALLQLIEQKKLGNFDIIAHSEGAITASIVASIEPGKTEAVILVSPAGLMIDDSFLRLSGRFLWYLLSQFKLYFNGTYKTALTYIKNSVLHIFKHPIISLKEALGVKNSNLINLLNKIDNSQVFVCIIPTKHDNVFPLSIIEKSLSSGNIKIYETIEGGHNALNIKPEIFIDVYEQFRK